MAAPLALLDDGDGFRDEGDVLVYVSTEARRAAHSADWFFDELAHRGARRILVDIRQVGAAGQGSRSVVYRRHRELAGRRVAILGSSRVQEFVITFLVAATGHQGTRFFTDEAAARAWLHGDAAPGEGARRA